MKLVWRFTFAALLLVSLFIQSRIFLNFDVIYLSDAAKRLLAGGTYTNDFFETNPPLILFLYLPAIFLAKLTSISLSVAMRIYFFSFIIACVSTCSFFLEKILGEKNPLRYTILLAISFVLLFLPVHQMGQREYFLILFSLPYLFLAILRIENKSLPASLAFAVGLFAGIGFALKPFFLTLPILIELYLIYKKRNLFSVFRIETLTIASFCVSYLVSIFYFFPDYIHVILPFVSRVYFIGMKSSWVDYFKNLPVIFCYSSLLFYGLTRKIDRYSTLSTVFFLAVLGFILTFTIPRSVWYYHVLPAMAMACILFAILLEQIIADTLRSFEFQSKWSARLESTLLIAMVLVIFAIPVGLSSYLLSRIFAETHDKTAKQLYAFFDRYTPNNTFTCFSVSSDYSILEYYSTAKYVGTSAFFWWQYGFSVLQKELKDKPALIQLQKDRVFAAAMVTHNLIQKKPRFVMIDTLAGKIYLKKEVDYIEELSQYKNFRRVWNQYRYATTIGRFKIFELKSQ